MMCDEIETERSSTEQFGWMLRVPGRNLSIVDSTLRPLLAESEIGTSWSTAGCYCLLLHTRVR